MDIYREYWGGRFHRIQFLFILLLCTCFRIQESKASVDLRNGNFNYSWVVGQLETGKSNFQIRLTYNSRSESNGLFGFGWCSEFEEKLIFENENTIILDSCGSGFQRQFSKQHQRWESGTDYIVREGNSFKLFRSAEIVEKFDHQGLLIAISIRGELFSISRIRESISQIDFSGQRLHFKYSDQNDFKVVRQLVHSNGKIIDFEYEDDQLVSMTTQWNNKITFSYDDESNLTSCRWPDGSEMKIAYDLANDWVRSLTIIPKSKSPAPTKNGGCTEEYKFNQIQETPKAMTESIVERKCGSEKGLIAKTTIEYFSDNKYLKPIEQKVRQEKGTRWRVLEFQSDGLLVGLQDSQNRNIKFTYNSHGQILKKESSEETIMFGYDEKGNISNIVNSFGNEYRIHNDQNTHIIEIEQKGVGKVRGKSSANATGNTELTLLSRSKPLVARESLEYYFYTTDPVVEDDHALAQSIWNSYLVYSDQKLMTDPGAFE